MLNFLSTISNNQIFPLSPQERRFLATIYETQKKRIWYAISQSVDNRFSIHVKEDLVQDTFIKLSRHLDLLMNLGKKEMEGYIFVVAKNVGYDFLRKTKHIAENIDNYQNFLPDQAINVEDMVIATDETHCIMAMVNSLSPQNFEAVYARFALDLEYQEIAERIGINKDTAKQRVYAAIRKVKKNILNMREVLNRAIK